MLAGGSVAGAGAAVYCTAGCSGAVLRRGELRPQVLSLYMLKALTYVFR